MKTKMLLLVFSSFLLIHSVNCDERQGRVLNRRNDQLQLEKQTIKEYQELSSKNASIIDASYDDVIDEIIYSSREGRNIEGLDDVYGDLNIKEALTNGNEIEARNLIRDKLCDLGLMQCDEIVRGKPPRYPTRVIYSQPPPGAVIYNNRPPISSPGPQIYNKPPPQLPLNGIYGPAKPIPMLNNPNQQPPRKVGYAHSEYNSFGNQDKYTNTDFFEVDQSPSAIKFGYTEKPTIVVNQNQGKREALQGGVSQNHHVHHHYVHVDGNGGNTGGLIDGTKTVLVNTPISEYSAVNSLSSSYQTSGFGSSNAAGSINSGGFTPMNSLDYKGVNSGTSSGIYAGSSQRPVYENNQYASGLEFNKYQQSLGPQAIYTEGTNGIYSNSGGVQQSFHSSAPDFYKKELNLNSNIRGLGYSTQQQQTIYNPQKQQLQQQQLYTKNQYNSYGGDKYQGFESSRQDQFDCVCVPFDQCPAQDVVGRRDDLILPLDPRNLPTEIEADAENNSTIKTIITSNRNSTEELVSSSEVKKISKRNVATASDDVKKVQGEGRIFGFGGVSTGSYGPNYGAYPGGKKILPTLGVSFGLPFPTSHYPLSPYAPHVPNAHFGAISPNGLNLGLLNVNPLFSLQITKNEHGEKLVKPFVNLHVTPNEGIVGKIGNLLLAKKGALHKHYHHHQHRYPPPPFHYNDHDYYHHHPIGGDIPPFLPHPPSQPHLGPIIHEPPPFHHHSHHGPNLYFGEHPPFFKDNGLYKGIINDDISSNPGLLFRNNNISLDSNANNYQSVYPQNTLNSLNFVNDDSRYARGFSHDSNEKDSIVNNNANIVHSLPPQAPGNFDGGEKVSFPSSRRKRDTDQPVPASIEKKEGVSDESIAVSDENDSESRAFNNGKRQAYYHQPQQHLQQKQCGPRAVCCRRPFKAPQPIQYNRCGVRNTQGITGRIKNPSYVDGDSEFGEWPWQVAILKKDPKESVYVCGGTLISDSFIITAAHCVKTYSGFDLRVRAGEWDVNHDVEFYPYVERDVISVHVHPEYYAGTLDNDIAILKLSAPIDFSTNPHITPACLPDKFTDYARQRCWTTGWGKDNWEYGKYQNILKEVDVPIVEQNTCQNQLRQTRLGYNYVLNPGFICAGGEAGKDACKGDGGGPLVCERNGVWQVVGAVSWGIGCGQNGVPGVYVRISHYLSWIEQITRSF